MLSCIFGKKLITGITVTILLALFKSLALGVAYGYLIRCVSINEPIIYLKGMDVDASIVLDFDSYSDGFCASWGIFLLLQVQGPKWYHLMVNFLLCKWNMWIDRRRGGRWQMVCFFTTHNRLMSKKSHNIFFLAVIILTAWKSKCIIVNDLINTWSWYIAVDT